jgi:hypothetical protein
MKRFLTEGSKRKMIFLHRVQDETFSYRGYMMADFMTQGSGGIFFLQRIQYDKVSYKGSKDSV